MVSLKTLIEELDTGKVGLRRNSDSCLSTEGECVHYLKMLKSILDDYDDVTRISSASMIAFRFPEQLSVTEKKDFERELCAEVGRYIKMEHPELKFNIFPEDLINSAVVMTTKNLIERNEPIEQSN